MSKPRVLYMLGWFYPDSVGGSERYVYMLARDIQEKGWEVTIAAPAIDEQEHHYNYDGIAVYRYPVSLRPSLAEIRVYEPPRYFEVFQDWLRKNRPDIVHIHSRTRGCGIFHMQYVKELDIPLVLTIHAADFMCVGGTAMLWGVYPCDGKLNVQRCVSCWLKKEGLFWPLAILLARTPVFVSKIAQKIHARWATSLAIVGLFIEKQLRDKTIFESVDKVVVVAKWLLKVLLLNGVPREKIFLSLHGLPAAQGDYKKPCVRRDSRLIRIGFIGRFTKIKGPHILIRAVKSLSLDVDVQLRLYGRANSAEDKRYLGWLRRIAGDDRRIKFLGELGQENYPEVMSGLDILAVPSLWLETGPLVVLEAFRCGIPVMGTNSGGIADLVTDGVNGILVDSGNVKSWTEAIMLIYKTPQLLEDWAGGISFTRSDKEVADEMQGLYKEVLNLHSGSSLSKTQGK